MKKILLLSFFILFLNLTHSYSQLTANFIAATTKGCVPLDSVQFTDLSTGNPAPTSWLWDFGNGTTSILQHPQASYPNAGVFTVTLTVGNGTTTDVEIKTGYITVFNLPVANFTYMPPQPCTGTLVTFYDNSTLGDGPIVSWNWGFGDGTTATVLIDSTTHTYSTSFTGPVSVIVTDSNGCKSDFVSNITVPPAPKAGFNGNPKIGCTVPFAVTFTDTSTYIAGTTCLWDFGDGGTSSLLNPPPHTYTAPGTYTVKLFIYQGSCTDSVVKPAYIKIDPYTIDFSASDTDVCPGDPITFNEIPAPTSVGQTWTFGDGGTSFNITPVHYYFVPGVYTVQLVAANASGCSDTVKKINYITVHPQPVAAFTANDTVGCSNPFTVNFTTPAGNVGWSWSFGDGGTSLIQNPTHSYTTAGSFTVTLIVTDSHGCKDTLIKPGYINIIPPDAQFLFTPKKGCAPLTVNFTSISTAIEPFFNYTWNYGDGSPNTVTTVGTTTHTYVNPGVYTVSLIVNTINGCKDTLIKVDSVLVGFHVTPSFTISDDTVCYHDPIQFTFNTANATEWVWFFGDGGVDSTQQNPIHMYGDTGTFTVTLVACNNGCCDTLVVPFMITILPPKAVMTLLGSCVTPYNVTCTSLCAGADSIVWNFHDGTPLVSNITPVAHTFATRGPKIITIYAYNFTTGCMDSMNYGYTVYDPIARFKATPLAGCFPLIVQLTDTSQDASSRTWYFGDGQFLYTGLTTISHTYALPGYYNVKLVIYDGHQCTDTLIKNNYIHVYGPLTSFTVNKDTGCAPLSVIFTDTTVSEYPIVSHIWNFGDGNIDTVFTTIVPHTYTNPGSYTVTLTVTDSQGCTHTLTIPNYVQPTLPTPVFQVDTFACPNKVITFNASASSGIGLSYHWVFGDGDTLDTTINTATHTYTANGFYVVSLTVTDQNLCDSTITHTIHIEKPVANFTSVSTYDCNYTLVNFTNTSTGTNLTSYYWNFGNGGSSFITSPSYQYTTPGIFSPYLVVTNSAGCSDTLKKDSLVVVYKPAGTFDFDPKQGCKPLEVTFTANASSVISSYSWNFGDGNLQTTSTNSVIHTYTYDITTQPELILYSHLPNGNTCNLKANVVGDSIITVNTFGSAAIAVDGDTSLTSITVSEGDQTPLSVIVNLGGSGNPTYLWSPTSALTFTSSDSSTVTVSGALQTDYYIYVNVIGQGGCRGLDSILVKFIPCDSHMETHNIFTPNGDGQNDEFYIEHPCPENFLLTIYNRWGQEVFKTSDPVAKWDGKTSGGEYVPAGTYYWILSWREQSLKGFLQLIRDKKN